MTEHIKMPDVPPLVRALGNGVQTQFEFPFPVFASEDVVVYLNGARQISGFDIDSGKVIFDAAPASGTIVTIERRMKFERLTDFIEGGDFSAAAINTELDYLVAGLQQVARDQSGMIKYSDGENPSDTVLPSRSTRANKALGFDGNGNPVAVTLEGSMAAPDFTAIGFGAVTRTSHDKFSDYVSVKDFGAVGDGLNDDTHAFQKAFAAHNAVFVPEGEYIINSTIEIKEGQSLSGAGDASVLKTSSDIVLIEMTQSYATLRNLKLFGGAVGLKLYGKASPCVNNSITDLTIWQAQTGILLDGYTSPDNPCYWNNFDRVLVAQPFVNGILLTKTGGGDTPNANRFHGCRVYSLGAATSGHGLYVEHGQFNNSFIDFEANMSNTVQACVRCGAQSNKTLFVNLYTESSNSVPNVRLDAGSVETAIYNLLSMSDGAAIWDFSGGQYTAYNAGFPYKNRLQRTTVTDLNTTLQRYDTRYTDTSGVIDLVADRSMQLLSSYSGAITARLPNAADATGVMMMIKKIDSSKNVITILENGGEGPDRTNYYLGSANDYVQMMSNGAEWFVISSNRSPGNTRYFDGSGIYDIDMAVDVYLLSSFGGALNARLPPADAPEAVGRMVTLKKTDVSGNAVTISEAGGAGPDGYSQTLSAQYQAITLVSDGGQWHIVSRF
ncbi:MAG: hypothetical protein DI586_02515 [Micavibrio aeruginosavorus]|uniref:Rhamnogalacturonase A/B/Epimerase-like pectate lyase domain-containing protein n=1 Tax=Micavibrio aeruginosavorus TaxID=349221 RepID=A0A2W5FSJ4_9BACT|nr:MAG: hypothetical protein DI586_02515 [Micavibrio aeruginosavorus]